MAANGQSGLDLVADDFDLKRGRSVCQAQHGKWMRRLWPTSPSCPKLSGNSRPVETGLEDLKQGQLASVCRVSELPANAPANFSIHDPCKF